MHLRIQPRSHKSVYLGKGITTEDAGKVVTGVRTWIGPKVTSFTPDYSQEVIVSHQGAAGTWIATDVYIEPEVEKARPTERPLEGNSYVIPVCRPSMIRRYGCTTVPDDARFRAASFLHRFPSPTSHHNQLRNEIAEEHSRRSLLFYPASASQGYSCQEESRGFFPPLYVIGLGGTT